MGRIEQQKKEDSSLIKSFFEDQFGALLTIVGGLPLLVEYFNLTDNSADFSTRIKAVGILTIIVSGVIILFIYNERKNFRGEVKYWFSLLGFQLILLGVFFFIGFNYLPYPTWNNGKLNTVSQYLKSYDLILFVLIASFFLNRIIWSAERIYTLLIEDYKNNINRKSSLYDTDKYEVSISSINQWERIFLFSLKYIKFFFKYSTIVIIITIVYIYFKYIGTFDNVINNKPIILFGSIGLRFIHHFFYIFYYPIFIIGFILLLTSIFTSYENRKNFYQNINSLSDTFYGFVESIVDNVVNFEEDFELNEKRSQLAKRLGKPDENVTNTEQRSFIWKSMYAMLEKNRDYIKKLSDKNDRILVASGSLTDDIFLKYLPSSANQIRYFRAVSYNDLGFWKHRGQEYLQLNQKMIENDMQVERIFLLDSLEYFLAGDRTTQEKEDELLEIYKQIGYGINVLICFKDEILAHDGTNYFTDLQYDFGIYSDFAVSFFEKPLKVGGRSLRMEFKDEKINDYKNYYKHLSDRSQKGTTFRRGKPIIDSIKYWNKAKKEAEYPSEKDTAVNKLLEKIKIFQSEFITRCEDDISRISSLMEKVVVHMNENSNFNTIVSQRRIQEFEKIWRECLKKHVIDKLIPRGRKEYAEAYNILSDYYTNKRMSVPNDIPIELSKQHFDHEIKKKLGEYSRETREEIIAIHIVDNFEKDRISKNKDPLEYYREIILNLEERIKDYINTFFLKQDSDRSEEDSSGIKAILLNRFKEYVKKQINKKLEELIDQGPQNPL